MILLEDLYGKNIEALLHVAGYFDQIVLDPTNGHRVRKLWNPNIIV